MTISIKTVKELTVDFWRKLPVGTQYSLLGHSLLLFLLLVGDLLFPSTPVPIMPSLKVDWVGLPTLAKHEMKNLRSSPLDPSIHKLLKNAEQDALRMQTPSKSSSSLSDSRKKQSHPLLPPATTPLPQGALALKNKKALDRLKALSRLEDTPPASPPVPQLPLLGGNRISLGTSPDGTDTHPSHQDYYNQLREKIQEHWTLPPWLSQQNWSAQVQLWIHPQGRLVHLRWVKPSGKREFDAAIQRTLNESSPFPPPPPSLAETLLQDGILIGFPL